MTLQTVIAPVEARKLQVVEYRNQRVVTTEQMAAGYGASTKNIQDNFLNNRHRFEEGKHFFRLEGDELRELKNRPDIVGLVGRNARSLTLWTERGAANHAKMLETDQAWGYHDDLVEFYFTRRDAIAAPADQASIGRKQLALMVLEAEEKAEALALQNNQLTATVESLEKHFTKGMTIPAFCKTLNGVNVSKMMWWAADRDWLYNEQRDPEKDPRWRVASYARDKYLTEEHTQVTPHGMDSFIRHSPVLLEKGCNRIYDLYMKGELPMKKSWDGEYIHDKAIYTSGVKP